MIVNISYIPNKKQMIFHECTAREAVYGGAKGGGKSCALVMEALAYGLENAGANMYLFRETYDDLEANLIKEWKEKVPKELQKHQFNNSGHYATLINGTTLKFRYIRNFQDAEGYQGRSMDWIGIDELTKHEKKSIQVLLSCLRSAKGFKVIFRGTCNPGGIGHVWVKEDFIDATNYGENEIIDNITGSKRAFIPAKVYDNDILMKNDPSYIRRLENLPDKERKAFLHGDWDIFEGQYFPEYKRDIHVIDPFQIPSNYRRFRSLDYGLDMTACYWWAVDTQGLCYIYREFNCSNLNLTEAAKKILELTNLDERIEYTVCSPDLWNRRQESGESGFEIMAKAGLSNMIKANNSRIAGWRVLREYLYHEKIKFFVSCPKIISHLPQLQHDIKNIEDASGIPHEITHAPESIRYGIMSRPRLSFPEKKKIVQWEHEKPKINVFTGGEVDNSWINY